MAGLISRTGSEQKLDQCPPAFYYKSCSCIWLRWWGWAWVPGIVTSGILDIRGRGRRTGLPTKDILGLSFSVSPFLGIELGWKKSSQGSSLRMLPTSIQTVGVTVAMYLHSSGIILVYLQDSSPVLLWPWRSSLEVTEAHCSLCRHRFLFRGTFPLLINQTLAIWRIWHSATGN